MRKYQQFWEDTKAGLSVGWRIRCPESLTPEKMYKRMCKAVQKEKHMDELFKAQYPYAELKFEQRKDDKCDSQQFIFVVHLKLNNISMESLGKISL